MTRRIAPRWGGAVALTVGVVLTGCAPQSSTPVPHAVPPLPGAPLPPIDVDAPGRTADHLASWAAGVSDATGIAPTALEAYGYAAAVMARSRPDCGIAWTTVAGIGGVESRHGTHRGARLAPDGTVTPQIRGVPLDGGPGVAEIPDTDGGVMDGDRTHDRAMGPMQFIPETWRRWGVDANGDGVADPDNLDDAALTAARYLCDRGGDLTTEGGWRQALAAYNLSGPYRTDVQDRANRYAVLSAP